MSEFNQEDFLSGLTMDDDAVDAYVNKMANEGASTEAPTIPECKVVALLQKMELNFSLTKGFLADPANWQPSAKSYNKDPFWYNLTGIFESQSKEVMSLLSRDTNPTYRVGGFDDKTVRRFPSNIGIITSTKANEAGETKLLGIDWTNADLVALLGEVLSQFGYAEKIVGTHTYTFSQQFFEYVNNGTSVLLQSLVEKARNGEAISEDEKKNDVRLIPYFIAAKQMENLSELLKQRPDEDKKYVITIGRRPREQDASRQENFVKAYVHTSTEGGEVALQEVLK